MPASGFVGLVVLLLSLIVLATMGCDGGTLLLLPSLASSPAGDAAAGDEGEGDGLAGF
jgi:hypothetical protein